MANIYFVGMELDCYDTSKGTLSEVTTDTVSGFSRGGIHVGGGVAYCPLLDPETGQQITGVKTAWLHFRFWCGNTGTNTYMWIAYTSAGVPFLRARCQSNFSFLIEYSINGGTTWTTTGLAYGTAYQGAVVKDIGITLGAGGSITLYGTASFAVDLSAISDIGNIQLGNVGGDGNNVYQQIIIADSPTAGWTVRRRPMNANGAEQEWTGAYANIDEYPYNTSDYLSTSVADNVSTFVATALAATPAGQEIKAVTTAALGRNDGTGTAPQKIASVLRSAGVDYEGPATNPGTATFSGSGPTIYPLNPATSAPWANITEVNATEFGVKAKA